MTKKELIELWNSLDDDAIIEFSYAYCSTNGKIEKFIIITD